MESSCVDCHSPGEFVCYCTHTVHCISCIGKHLLKSPDIMHKPVSIKDQKLRNLLTASLPSIKSKESEILMEASTELALEKLCKTRVQEEMLKINEVCLSTVKKIKDFFESLKEELSQICEELEKKVEEICENFKGQVEKNLGLVQLLKKIGSKDAMDSLEISSISLNLPKFEFKKTVENEFFFDVCLANDVDNQSSTSLQDTSQSIDLSLRKNRVSRVSKKSFFHVFSALNANLLQFNLLTKEKTLIGLEINTQSVCTVLGDGSLFISGGKGLKSVFLYENSEKILKLPDMQTARFNHTASSLSDSVYIIGGNLGQGPTRSCEKFDLVLKTWTKIEDLNIGREKHVACAHKGKVFVAGGCGVNSIEVLSSDKFTLTKAVLKVGGPGFGFSAGEKMIIFHGNAISSFDLNSFSLEVLTEDNENDWYLTGNVLVFQNLASFVREEKVFYYDIENREISCF